MPHAPARFSFLVVRRLPGACRFGLCLWNRNAIQCSRRAATPRFSYLHSRYTGISSRGRTPEADGPAPLASMWRLDYKFLAGRRALFQANAGDQRLHERFSFGKSIRLFPNIKSVLEKGLAGCLEFIQTGNKGVKGQGCPDTAFCRGS